VLTKLGVKRKVFMDALEQIHQVFINRIFQGYELDKAEVYMNVFSYQDDYYTVKLNGLKYIPRVGERITIPFLRTGYGNIIADVTEVGHEFECGIHIISIVAKDPFAIQKAVK
jgi:hypothetical protein